MATDTAIPRDVILNQLEQLLKSSVFLPSKRLSRFLRFTIEKVIDGRAEDLKEYTIGAEVYDRKPPYSGNEYSIVRVEAARLRAKLKIYYDGEGKEDSIQFHYRLGSYVPAFQLRPEDNSTHSGSFVEPEESVHVFKLAVLPFADNSATKVSTDFAQGVTDEVISRIMATEGVRLVAASVGQSHQGPLLDIPSLTKKFGVEMVIRGSVREHDKRVRVAFELVNASGLEVWSLSLEGTSDADGFLDLEAKMASTFIARVAPQCLTTVRLKRQPWETCLSRYPEMLAAETLLDRGDRSSTDNALGRFQHLAKHLPNSARPWTGIAQCHYWLALSGDRVMPARVGAAEKAAIQALATDGEAPTSQVAQGCVSAMQHDWRRAEESYRNAISAGSYMPAYRLLADLLVTTSRFEEATQLLEMTQEIDPFSCRQKAIFSRCLYMNRRFEDLVARHSIISRYGPLPTETLVHLAHSCVQLRLRAQALDVVAQLEVQARGYAPALCELAEILALLGDISGALKIVGTISIPIAEKSITMVRRSLLSIALGDRASARYYLNRAAELKELELYWLSADPRFDPIRDTDFFVESIGVFGGVNNHQHISGTAGLKN